MLRECIKIGEDFEEYVRDILKYSGFYVETTARSHDYGADLIVKRNGLTYCVQCKWSKNPIGVSAVQEAVASLVMYRGDRPVVVTNSVFTSEAKRLAIMNGCLLFDGPGCEPYVSNDSACGMDLSMFQGLI